MKEKFHAVFKGAGSACVVLCEIENDKLHVFERNPILPFLRRKRCIGGNIQEKLKIYETRPNYNVRTGERTDPVRFYPFSLEDFQDDHIQMNAEIIRELESKRSECNYLLSLVVELRDILQDAGMMDVVKRRFKDNHEFFVNEMKNIVPVEKTTKKKK